MRMELACCESVIEDECQRKGSTQKDVASLYAMALVSTWKTDWLRANNAIAARWPKGLERVKTMAWKMAENGGNL